jgi:D-alanyl-D-alanine carboxypeptidase/D-alanyl-D-alanine-endopeptidase (penicillin-binding protein 4)
VIRRALIIAAALAGLAGLLPAAGAASPASVSATLARIASHPRYRQADWGYRVLDARTGRVLVTSNAQKMFDPGSTMKTYSVSTALRLYGTDYRFHTPVYKQGTVAGGTLTGNLVLVGSGDMSLGLREQPNGTLFYENFPEVDQSYANTGLPAIEPPGNPLAGLDELAADVRAAGITAVNGNVVVDARLFTPYGGFPNGLISPIWVNENLIDLLVKPGVAAGQPATIDWRPMTASYQVVSQVTTVAAKQPTTLSVAEPTPGTIVVTGQIPAGSPPALRVWQVADPSSFARTAFIEALRRAGVAVSAPSTGPNPAALLPPPGSYQASDLLGQHVSATLAQFATLILKTSYNRGADLMTCLSAVRAGSTTCTAGLGAELRTAIELGVTSSSFIPFDGAGSDDRGRTTPGALATFLRRAIRTPYGATLASAFPLLGRNGTLANVETRSPAAGRAQVKTGNRVETSPTGQIIVLGNSLAGYATTKSGRRVTFMVAVGNVPIRSALVFEAITDDQARMVVAIQQGL